VSVLEGRAEELVKERSDLAGTFDVVVARAVGASILPIAMRYLRPGGLFLAGGPPVSGGSGDDSGRVDPTGLRHDTKAFDQLGLKRSFRLSQKHS
jgi:hypothetical protein